MVDVRRRPHSSLTRRQAGVLLHPSSLPGPGECGELGDDAYRFVDFLAANGIRVWQVLPLGPTHEDLSPYQSLSAFAGNRRLISPHRLVQWGWLDSGALNSERSADKFHLLGLAYRGFLERANSQEREEWQQFCRLADEWLDDYAMFCMLRKEQQMRAWCDWPEPVRNRDPDALRALCTRNSYLFEQIRFEQFVFFRQWQQLKRYANERNIQLFGDIPIFVAHDSADVWSLPAAYRLDEHGRPVVVAGVPPDYFSATGQRWGNPHYDWEWMEANDFHWWRARLAWQLKLFDLVRIDHFRGFESYWEIPAHEMTAINGRWVKAPGGRLFNRLLRQFDPLPLVAEDLGIITPEVEALRERYDLPGMRILQFAFDGGAGNPYLPHNHTANCVVYTGTHDNNTSLGWFQELSPDQQKRILHYFGEPQEEMPWLLLRAAFASVARLAIVPMQDILALGGEHRMNTPGTTQGNWRWRFQWEWLNEEIGLRLRQMVALYGR